MARLRDKDLQHPGPPPSGHPFVLREHQRRRSLRERLAEPGARPALALVVGFFLMIYGSCLLTAFLLGSLAGVTSLAGTLGLAGAMFGMILVGWALLSLGPRALTREGGLVDAMLARFWTPPAKPIELDEGPMLLARRRGQTDEALRLYREAMRELPHRLDLRYRLAEIDDQDRKDREAATRGYRDFLRRVEAAGRAPSAVEAELTVLAETRLRDLETAGAPQPPRVIKL